MTSELTHGKSEGPFSSTPEGTPEMVPANWVLAIMMKLVPAAPWMFSFGETSTAISQAANDDPLFAGEDGRHKTAAVLIALAYHESRFQPNVVGDSGHSFGLFQIQPPTAKVDASLLLLPRNAAYIAIDLIRTSFSVCRSQPQQEKLSWFAAGGNGCKIEGRKASKIRMSLADKIFKENRPASPPLLPEGT
jgi:hypothetical protein